MDERSPKENCFMPGQSGKCGIARYDPRRYDPRRCKQCNNNKVSPFLRWAGGKTWLLKKIDEFVPEEFNNYYEPFLGSGALFFHFKQKGKVNKEAVLSDLNEELIECYVQIRDKVESVIDYLMTYKNEKEFYYRLREYHPRSKSERAAKFIYLNRTSFNGIYRVNLKGIYNVPYGNKKYKVLFDFTNLRRVSKLLHGVRIIHQDFQSCLGHVDRGDLVFLDPPYTVAHENNGFIKYNQRIFAWQDQERLKSIIIELINKGAYFVLTNAAHPNIKELFASCGGMIELKRFSVVGGKKAKRDLKSEYVFSNFIKKGVKRI